MASKMVIDRQRTAAYLRGALASHAPTASAKFLEILEPDLRDEEPAPDMESVQRLLRRRLDRLRAQLVRADQAHNRDLEVLERLRERRDAAVAELAHLLARLRSILVGLWGRQTCSQLLGFQGNTPRDPVVLHQVVRRLVTSLRDDDFPVPASTLGGLRIDPIAWSHLLEEPAERLGRSLEEIALEHQDAATALIHKNEAMATYDHAYKATSRMLQELYRYVGMTEMAEKVRPRRRRRRKAALQVERTIEDELATQERLPEQETLAKEDQLAQQSTTSSPGPNVRPSAKPRLFKLLSGLRS